MAEQPSEWARAARRLGAASPAELAAGLAAAIAVIHTVRLLWFTLGNAYFQIPGDDLTSFWQAKTLPFWKFLFLSIDVHYVPLHRLVTYSICHAAPMNFVAAEVVLVAFHVLGCVALFGALTRIRRTPWNGVLVAWYALVPFLASQLYWWTAGLHRLPYILLANAATYFYLGYRTDGARSSLALVVACVVLALGFFPKGILIPPLLLGLEIALRVAEREESRLDPAAVATRRRVWPLFAAAAAVCAAYLAAWIAATPPVLHQPNLDRGFLLVYLRWSWSVFGLGTVGYLIQSAAPTIPWIAGAWGAAFVYSVLRSRASAAAWLCGALLITLNVYSGTSRARANAFGPFVALTSDRYYFELFPIVALFGAIVIRQLRPGPFERAFLARPWARWCAATCVVAALAWLARNSFRSTKELFAANYSDSVYAKVFLDNLRHDLSRIPRDKDGSWILVDSNIVGRAFPMFTTPKKKSELLKLMGERPRVVPPRPGAHWITASGHIFRL